MYKKSLNEISFLGCPQRMTHKVNFSSYSKKLHSCMRMPTVTTASFLFLDVYKLLNSLPTPPPGGLDKLTQSGNHHLIGWWLQPGIKLVMSCGHTLYVCCAKKPQLIWTERSVTSRLPVHHHHLNSWYNLLYQVGSDICIWYGHHNGNMVFYNPHFLICLA